MKSLCGSTLFGAILLLSCDSGPREHLQLGDTSRMAITAATKTRVAASTSPAVVSAPPLPDSRGPFFVDTATEAKGRTSLSCNSALRDGDTLTIRMPRPHGQYLLIDYPDGHPVFVVYPTRGLAGRVSLMDAAAFRAVTVIRLIVGETRGTPWIYGRDTLEPLLKESGTYRITVGDDMETDYPTSPVKPYSCRVRVVQTP